MNLMELLQLVDNRLRPLVGANESALQVVIDEVAAGPRPVGVSPDVEPRTLLAGRLLDIESECRMLREQLHVQLTPVAQVEITGITFGPSHPRKAPADTNAPDTTSD